MKSKLFPSNSKLISFYGIQRSGNHATILWLCGMINNPLFINNLMPNKDIVKHHSPISLPNGVRFISKKKCNKIIFSEKDLIKENGGPEKNGNMIISYENLYLSAAKIEKQKQHIQNKVGFYQNKIDIILIRNPLNMMASQINLITHYKNKLQFGINATKSIIKNIVYKRELYVSPKTALTMNALRHYCNLWAQYSELYLKCQQFENKTIYILFDRWFLDQEYRVGICNLLGLDYNEKNINFISDAGGGSSFSQNPTPNELHSGLNYRYQNSLQKELLLKILKENPVAFQNWKKIFNR
jgi:hypothetical protein